MKLFNFERVKRMSESKQMIFARNLVCLCVDAAQDGDYSGKLWHQYSDEPVDINDSRDFMIKMEEILDAWDFPQRSLAERFFKGKSDADTAGKRAGAPHKLPIDAVAEAKGVRNIQNKRGELGTFVIRISYRQNASWQGRVIHAENDTAEDFLSELELIKFIDRELQN